MDEPILLSLGHTLVSSSITSDPDCVPPSHNLHGTWKCACQPIAPERSLPGWAPGSYNRLRVLLICESIMLDISSNTVFEPDESNRIDNDNHAGSAASDAALLDAYSNAVIGVADRVGPLSCASRRAARTRMAAPPAVSAPASSSRLMASC